MRNDLLSRIWTDVTTLLLPLVAIVAYALGSPAVANVFMLLWLACFYGTAGGRPVARWRRSLRRRGHALRRAIRRT